MNYIEIVNDTIQYIESNLHRELRLEELASRYYIYPMHFYRIFRAVTNQTVKSYILGRKLSEAAIALKNTERRVVDIAFQYGFNSHEQFTRSFERTFHITPSRYRKENISVSLLERMDIVERDFRNEKKDIIVNYSYLEQEEIKLLGKEIFFQPEIPYEGQEASRKILNFAREYFVQGGANRLFTVNRSDRGDPRCLYCFYGIAAEEYSGARSGLTEGSIPKSKYAVFRYPGNMGLVFNTVMKDLHKWISITELEFNSNVGIDMFDLFTEDYMRTGKFYMHVPVF